MRAPFILRMVLVWLDGARPEMEEPALRVGGWPLMEPTHGWPECDRCGGPMAFRAQVPVALTLVVPPDDARLMLVFECRSYVSCAHAVVRTVSPPHSLRTPPAHGPPVKRARGGRLVPMDADASSACGPDGEGPAYGVIGAGAVDAPDEPCACGSKLRLVLRLWSRRPEGDVSEAQRGVTVSAHDREEALEAKLCVRCERSRARIVPSADEHARP